MKNLMIFFEPGEAKTRVRKAPEKIGQCSILKLDGIPDGNVIAIRHYI
ncbi:hypothetical protein [Terrimonas pollutisoli]|nr:hypothetical protein [Terrimonas sp. H1YJ31]